MRAEDTLALALSGSLRTGAAALASPWGAGVSTRVGVTSSVGDFGSAGGLAWLSSTGRSHRHCKGPDARASERSATVGASSPRARRQPQRLTQPGEVAERALDLALERAQRLPTG